MEVRFVSFLPGLSQNLPDSSKSLIAASLPVCVSLVLIRFTHSSSLVHNPPFDGFPISGSWGLLSLSFLTTTFFLTFRGRMCVFFFCLISCRLVGCLISYSLPFWFVCRYFCFSFTSLFFLFFVKYIFECYVSGFLHMYIFFKILFSQVCFFIFLRTDLSVVPSLTSSVSFSDGWLRLRDTRSIPPSLVQQSVSSSACPTRHSAG